MNDVLVLHGPNLNLLGNREPEHYGRQTLAWMNDLLVQEGRKLGLSVSSFQSNHEGALIDQLHAADGNYVGVVFNPGGYTHTSVALRDAVAGISIPVVEVHLSNVSARETFRQTSLIAPVCAGTVAGFGWVSYLLGLKALAMIFESGQETTA